MNELPQVRSALDDIKKQDHVLEASLVSRGGMYVMGAPPKGVHRETFAAMSAIILGAAETTSTELKDKLAKVVIELTEQDIIFIGVGPKYLVAISVDKEADRERITQETKNAISMVESML